jgi:hypothetical protein
LKLKNILDTGHRSSDRRSKTSTKFQDIIKQKNEILNTIACSGNVENRRQNIEKIIQRSINLEDLNVFNTSGINEHIHYNDESMERKNKIMDSKLFLRLNTVV